MISPSENAPRTIDIGLDLLDRQLLDRDERPAGKVDDVELTFDEDGVPVLTAILSGPGALAPRLGRLADLVASWRLRLEGRAEPGRVPFGSVTRVRPDVRLAITREELDSMVSERWATRIVRRIPGAR